MPRTVFDVPALKARQQDLEQLASQSDFWDDQKAAQAKMRQLDEVRAQLEQLAAWRAAVVDGEATLERYGLEPDGELLAESNMRLAALLRRQGQPEVAVPLLVEVLTATTPASAQGRKAYQQLVEIGFVTTPYAAGATAGN